MSVRLGLLFRWFNYGKKGILHRDHHCLFTPRSLAKLLEQCGMLPKIIGILIRVSKGVLRLPEIRAAV